MPRPAGRAAVRITSAPERPALSESPQRPNTNENYLLINAFATHPESPLLSVSRRIADEKPTSALVDEVLNFILGPSDRSFLTPR